ncbi:uncharacterized protein N0V89_006613 [Didymosphaeria variabile]|uniref:DUF7702 domain-containing protein n=1 Tax=Didymosphaeria variabile TaxID=1932322 RepID=A0A9W8XHP3_9PLEO|nr:uncharacterized protein N0V89_006613 [Didymosphaeria variabile]KAJ4351274.1 hypothetical protein N0V89_006613 [Didymosphaeria variabile]
MALRRALVYGAVVNVVTLVIYFIYLCIAIWLSVALDLAATVLFPETKLTNTTLETGVAILTEISLTPLFLSTASVLNMTSGPKGRRMQWVLLLLYIPLIISLILIVAGGIDPDSRDTATFAATPSTKAGIVLYCACFVVLIWATTIIAARLYLANPLEVKILTTVVLSLPFFLVDVVYMMCFAFEGSVTPQRFNVISGDVTIQLCMQVIMEYIIVGLYLGLGLKIPDKAAKLKEIVLGDHDYEQLRETFLWKMYEAGSATVAVIVMPGLRLSTMAIVAFTAMRYWKTIVTITASPRMPSGRIDLSIARNEETTWNVSEWLDVAEHRTARNALPYTKPSLASLPKAATRTFTALPLFFATQHKCGGNKRV